MHLAASVAYLHQSAPLQPTARNIALPDPFPIPMFKIDVEKSLCEKKLCADDRKYIVRVLATVLLTHVQRPSKRQCEVVAKSLLNKFPFLKEYVSLQLMNTVHVATKVLLLFI